jgi:hypothetical protein
MTRRKTTLLLASLLLAAGLWWLLRAPQWEPAAQIVAEQAASMSPAAGPSSPTDEARTNAAIEKVVQAYQTPIAFYGRVVDQTGESVSGASVTYAPIYNLLSNTVSYTGTSDATGYFFIENLKGIALSVGVRKEGYYFIDDQSNATFAYGTGTDAYRKAPPTKENPAIFVLHKMGTMAPLVSSGTRSYKVTKNGQPLEVNLETGTEVPAGQGDIRFERWANDQEKNPRGHFDWRFRITVPGGGLAERNGQFDFEAPADGYKERAEIDMPASLGDEWNYTANKSYFVKLRDGRYARFDAMIQAGHNTTPLVVESFLNSKPGSRNLEYDPKQASGIH